MDYIWTWEIIMGKYKKAVDCEQPSREYYVVDFGYALKEVGSSKKLSFTDPLIL